MKSKCKSQSKSQSKSSSKKTPTIKLATVDELVGALERNGVESGRARRWVDALHAHATDNRRAKQGWKDVRANVGLAVLYAQVPGLTLLPLKETDALRADVCNRPKPRATDTLSLPEALGIEEWPADGWPRCAWVISAGESAEFASACLTINELVGRWGCPLDAVEKHLRTGALRAMVDISGQRIESARGIGKGLLGTYRLLHPRPAQVLAGTETDGPVDALVFRWVAVTSDETLAVRPIEFALTGIHPPLSRSDLRVPLAEVARFERTHKPSTRLAGDSSGSGRQLAKLASAKRTKNREAAMALVAAIRKVVAAEHPTWDKESVAAETAARWNAAPEREAKRLRKVRASTVRGWWRTEPPA